MGGHDIIVVGASAGGVQALTQLIGDLPADLPASVLVVLHVPPTPSSALPAILARRAALPVAHATDREPLGNGRVYVASPDHHLLVVGDHVGVTRGPKENGHRPAVDALFRSAATAAGPRVVGVVLSGTLNDGTAGLRAVKDRGGVGVVQDPDEALYPGMPRHALEGDHPDHVLQMVDMAPVLVRLVTGAPPPTEGRDSVPDDLDAEMQWAHPELSRAPPDDSRLGMPSGFTCPECHGGLWELEADKLVRFRCRVGHGFTGESLASLQGSDVEAAMWTAYRALEERAALCRKLAAQAVGRGSTYSAAQFGRQAEETERRAQVLRMALWSVGDLDDAGESDPSEG